ncbi:MAG: hypothetical protein O8C62_03105 [Candidatus Methanoperedens sp.]|nr:hypothetical protein [Candidatus Methanoperedens sp.]
MKLKWLHKMRVGNQPGDLLKGEQILALFKKEEKRTLKNSTGHHRGNESIFKSDVECILEFQIRKKIHKL